MAEIVRSLLQMGNAKVGQCISTWSLPAGIEATCPGASPKCLENCYALRSRFTLPAVKARMAWNWEQSRMDSFAGRMVKEIRKKGHLVIRVHVSGDFESEVYALKWLEVMRACPKARFYWYSRSHVVPAVAKVLGQMAALKCCVGYYSVDGSMQMPAVIPPGVRLAYLQTAEGEEPELVDLVFRVRRLRGTRIPLAVTCPSESPRGHGEVTWGGGARCFVK